MNWKTKALTQNVLALLPRPVGDAVYFRLQRRLGTFQELDRKQYFAMARRIDVMARARGRSVDGAVVLEVGSGWDLTLATALWLLGARQVVSVDLNRHFRPEMFRDCIRYLVEQPAEIEAALGEATRTEGFRRRLDQLRHGLSASSAPPLPREIDYRAPSDAAHVDLPSDGVDLHVSRSVLEHVPESALTRILGEGRRLVGTRGLLVHGVDFSDHFAHTDTTISSVHFLRFSPAQWNRIAGNRFMYHNRLRVDDLEAMFRDAGFRVSVEGADVDARALAELSNGPPVDARYRGRRPETLATASAWLVAEAGA